MISKDELRRTARVARDAVDAVTRAEWSQRIAEHGAALLRERVTAGTIVSAYWPMRSEADPRPFAVALRACGAELCLPAFVGKVMEFRRWRDGDALAPAGFQTFEPLPSAPVRVPAIVLAPLLAFDRRGARLGWGKGYYDTFLGALDAAAAGGNGSRPFVVGVAFGCQEVNEVPLEPHDRRLDAVVTEAGGRRC